MSEPYWIPVGPAVTPLKDAGTWSGITSYLPGDIVLYQGSYYLAAQASSGVTPPASALPVTSYGTTVPSSPKTGDIWFYPADATAGVVWQLRYNGASASAYKWEFVGGAPLYGGVPAATSTTSTTFVDLTGPSITLPRAGDYEVSWGCAYMWASVAAASAVMAITATGIGDPSGFALFCNNAQPTPASKTYILPGISTPLKLQYRASSGATASFTDRWMTARPVRVS